MEHTVLWNSVREEIIDFLFVHGPQETAYHYGIEDSDQLTPNELIDQCILQEINRMYAYR